MASTLRLDPPSSLTQFQSTQNQPEETMRQLRTLPKQNSNKPNKPTKEGNPATTIRLVTKSLSPHKTSLPDSEHPNYPPNGQALSQLPNTSLGAKQPSLTSLKN